MTNRYVLLIALTLAGQAGTAARAEVRVAKIFGDYMVLQRDKPIPVWGWANPGEEVTVEFAGQSKQAAADDNGKWMATLAPVSAGGPHTLAIQGDAPPPDEQTAETEEDGRRGRRRQQPKSDAPLPGQVLIRDVLVGEVWICSGQSNMEWPVTLTLHAGRNLGGRPTEYSSFQCQSSGRGYAARRLSGEWKTCTPDSVADFTAVGYFFGRHLQTKLQVPIGLIGTNWGGTIAEAWTSRKKVWKGMRTLPPFSNEARNSILRIPINHPCSTTACCSR